MASRYLSMEELNKAALDHFVYQPVTREMISYLASAAHGVITCDSSLMPPTSTSSSKPSTSPSQDKNLPPTPPRTPSPRSVASDDSSLPTLEEFITQLVVSSNVQVPTLMSTLVYLTRLKSKLQPMARGLRCTTHRIFLATLILAAKYLNDSSPKNKHWANYSHITTDYYQFGFSRTEVNLMEKQLLFLLEWDLRITEQDLYRELNAFLEPLRIRIAERHARKMRHRLERTRELELQAAAAAASAACLAVPQEAEYIDRRGSYRGSVTPPGLSYSSAGSSYTPSVNSRSSERDSRSTTPSEPESYMYDGQYGALHESPVEIILDSDVPATTQAGPMMDRIVSGGKHRLPYEITEEEYQQLQDTMGKKRQRRGVWGRLLGNTVAVR